MEDTARLAQVEESVRDVDKFRKVLYELLQHIKNILDNPHDYQLRTIKSNILKEVAKFESFNGYLKYVGFNVTEDNVVYPNTSTLSNLRMAQVAIERKINFCYGSIDNNQIRLKAAPSQPVVKINTLKGNALVAYEQPTTNRFLLKIQDLFNNMLVYEDPELQALARAQIPMVTLQLMALDRVREQQMELKTGKIQGHDLPFDIALLMELLGWFKHKFFSWVDKPDCEKCGGPTTFSGTTTMTNSRETCRVEVFDFDSNTWLHADPCEAKLNTPLMYCHGWGKKLSYVIAVSRDDLQDVTWRYTMDHKQVLKRRTECTEIELISSILSLRAQRQRHVSEPRRLYLARRTAQELVQLMVEKSPGEFESHGRVSGSAQWRRARGEAGTEPHAFALDRPATYAIRYYSATDKYRVTCDDVEMDPIKHWAAGAYQSKNIFRKVENDWEKAYLAREEGETSGCVSWKFTCSVGLRGVFLCVRALHAVFESGSVQWSVGFDQQPLVVVALGETPKQFECRFSTVTIRADLSGGAGELSWQHAQLFRQALSDGTSALDVLVRVETEP